MSESAVSALGAVRPVEAIRPQFPALRREHRGRPVAYFDGPGGTQVPEVVADRMRDYLLNHNANTHWAYPTSEETDAAIADARLALADFLGSSPDEVAFGANMTTLTFHVSRALARGWRRRGDRRRARSACARTSMRVRVARVSAGPDSPLSTPNEEELDVAPHRTGVHAPDATPCNWRGLERAGHGHRRGGGSASGARRGSALLRRCGPLRATRRRRRSCARLRSARLFAVTFYGPHLGTMYVRQDLLERLDVPKVEPAADNAPDRLETGTLSHEAIAGAAAAVDFLASLSPSTTVRRDALQNTMAGLHERNLRQVTRLWTALRELPGVSVYGPPPSRPRTSTLSFVLAGVASTAVARHCATRGLFVSNGDFYALTVVRRLGHLADGLVRLGCAAYTTDDEVERVIAAISELAR